jgi:hypothetical protein
MQTNYLEGIKKQFLYYKSLGEKTFEQLSEEEILAKPSEESNSISIITKHLVGNMLSRFTDFLTSDGEKEWRNREQEFEGDYIHRAEMLDRWEYAWSIVFEAIESIEDIEQIVYIRNQGHTVYEALNRQLAHYAYHIGQVVYLGKMYKDSSWKSLSIPKNQSEQFNQEKFSKEKSRGHFTDDFLKKS